MYLTLFHPSRSKSFALVKYLYRLVRKGIRPVLIVPKTSVSMEDGLALGRMISKISTEETQVLLTFAESFHQAVRFCTELGSGKLGSSGRELPIFIDITHLQDSREDRDLGEMIQGLGEKWTSFFPLTCFLEIGRDSTRLGEASGRTSLFQISSLVLERKGGIWKRLKEERAPSLSEDWTEDLIYVLLPEKD
ncbi:hypothetical protein EHO59_05785 [Leptospira semungkisensis]|uniref:Uncharacterized protein n=1 Tax=Leptospira semungkisensis TaxID=2484985 RepID=A0A4R9G980_9LEPT|nr:hypothetical protein [Leptospira semungkisensis]TGK07610.1 hypothetical protein EHO59_05785 [Leptospira semungkisensis]